MTTDRTIKALIFEEGDEMELSPSRSAGGSASPSSSEENERWSDERRSDNDAESNRDEASTSGREEGVEEEVEVVEPVKKRRRLVKKHAVNASLQASSSVVKQKVGGRPYGKVCFNSDLIEPEHDGEMITTVYSKLCPASRESNG